MTEQATAPDLYSYGRAPGEAAAAVPTEPLPAYVCVGCGASVAANDPALVSHLGWRLLPRIHEADPDRPVLCPRCARRHLALLR